MPISPETKSWTWVLERACPECGFDAQGYARELVGSLVRDNAARWPALLASPQARIRPSDDRWSALEYGCHVRDVLRIYDYRLTLMLDNDGPSFPNWDQDASAIDDRYDEQDPATVAGEIAEAAEVLAARFETVAGDQWDRSGFRSDGAAFTIESFSRYFVHDPIHHVHDVEQGFKDIDG
jgi:DinB superfamily